MTVRPLAAAAVAGIAAGLISIAAAHEDDHTAAEPGPTAFTAMTPILNVESVEASIEHYTSVLGFRKEWDWPAEDEDKSFASISNGRARLYLAENNQGARPVWIYYGVDDADALHERYLETGAQIQQKPVDRPWGAREMLVVDPDGHVLRIGGPVAGDH